MVGSEALEVSGIPLDITLYTRDNVASTNQKYTKDMPNQYFNYTQ